MLLLYTLRKRSKSVTKFFLGSHSSQCDQESRPSRSRNNTSEINLSSSQGDGKSLKGKANKPELLSSAPKMSSAPLPYISSSKNSSSVSMASNHVLYTPSQMLSVPQRIASAPIHVPELPCGEDFQDHSNTSYTNNKETRKGIHSDEILIQSHKRALPRALPLTSAPPALTAKQILTAQKVERVSRLPSKKLLHLFPPPPPPPSSPPPAIPSSASSSVSSSPACSPPPSPFLSKSKRPTNYPPAPCVYLSTPPSTCSSNNASPLLKKGRRRSQSASATTPPKAKTMIPVPVTRSSRSSPSHPSDQHHQPIGGFASSSSSSSRKSRHQRSRSSVLDGSNFSAPDLLQHCPTPRPPSSPMLHSRPRLAESDPLRFPISTPMIVQIPRPVTWTFKGGRPRSQSSDTPSTPPMTPPRSRNGSVSSSGPRTGDKHRQSVTSNSSTVVSHGTSVAGGSVGSVYTHCDSYDNDYEYAITSLFQQSYHQCQKTSMESSSDHDHELQAIISDAIAKTAASGPFMARPMPMQAP
ncbi:hypothetical protein BG003_000699 [Podila horticola]|nr:hypothetical protein BG003_000699 [Podila horticola]